MGAQGTQQPTVGEDDEMRVLSTGLDTFDEAFERKGIRLGTLVAVTSDPTSPGEIFAANMIANRPAYYYTCTKRADHVKRNIKNLENVDLNQVKINQVDSEQPIDPLLSGIRATEYPKGVTIVVDPVNVLENASLDDYRRLLQELEETVHEAEGVGVLYGLSPQEEPDNRWMTTSVCDTVLAIQQDRNDETIKYSVAIQKVYPKQNLIDEESRVFELTTGLEMDVASSRNVSP